MKAEPIKKLEKLPTIDQVKLGINQLILIDNWNKYKIARNPEKFQKRLHELFVKKVGIFPITSTSINSDTFPFTFYRLRKYDKSMNPNLISEHSYPPNYVINNYQRANIPKHPVFYCSDNASTCIFEVLKSETKLNPDDYFYLSEWKFIDGVDIRLTPYLFGNLSHNSPYQFWTESIYFQIHKLLDNNFPTEEIEGFKKVLEYLSNLFVYENTYTVSSFIAHQHLYANHTLRSDIFVYPSIQTDQYSVNFAIHPNVVIEKMKLLKVYKFKILNFSSMNRPYTYTFEEIGTNKDSIIFWNNVKDKDHNGLKKIFNLEL